MNCVIIDDDSLSRSLIETFIQKTTTLKLIGSFSNPVDALNMVQSNNTIDLLFLDILMPEMNGIQILDILKGKQQIIVISGKKEFALETFKYNVTDYLLKPITYERFFKAIDKAYERNHEMNDWKNNDHFLVKKGLSFCRVHHKDILVIEADSESVFLYTSDDKYKVISSIEDIECFLPKEMFCKIHNDYLINLFKVRNIYDDFVEIDSDNFAKQIPLMLIEKQVLLKKIEFAKSNHHDLE